MTRASDKAKAAAKAKREASLKHVTPVFVDLFHLADYVLASGIWRTHTYYDELLTDHLNVCLSELRVGLAVLLDIFLIVEYQKIYFFDTRTIEVSNTTYRPRAPGLSYIFASLPASIAF